nr:DUF5696 domain-containing protein [Paenibacillus bovis]
MRRYIGIFLSVVLIVTTLIIPSSPGIANEENDTNKLVQKEVEQVDQIVELVENTNMNIVLENDDLVFYMDKETFEFAVVVKSSGDVWYSNPPDKENDTIATGVSADQLKSQLSIRYYNQKVQESSMNSYTDSVALEQATMEVIDDGVRVTYKLGEEVKGNMIPQIITIERMEPFLNAMDDEEKNLVESIYKRDEDEGKYILRTASATFKQKDAAKYLEEAGYTLQDYYKDNEENGVEGVGGAVFTIPVEYKLDKDNFIARLLVDKVEYVSDYPLTNIKFLEFFGAAGLEDEGYIFVPDGSGALIYLNNGKTKSTTYVSRIYGDDETLTYDTISNKDKELSARIPVFGIKKEEKAMLAIVEEAEAYASVYGDVSGKTNSYNRVFSEFNYLPNGESSLESMTGTGILQLYQKKPYQGAYQVRYRFLPKEEATYVGMANSYQQYLIDNDILKEKSSTTEDLPFYLGLIGGINVTKRFIGIPYQGTEILTTYEQANSMVDSLQKDGIQNLRVKYSGWFNGGLNHYFPNKIRLLKGVDKGFKQKEFLNKMKESNIPIFFDADFGYIYDDRLFDGFSTSKDSARFFDNSLVEIAGDDLTQKVTGRDSPNAKSKFLLNTRELGELVDNFIEEAEGKSINNISLRTITSTVASDFSKKKSIGRQESLEKIEAAMRKFSDASMKMLGNNSNAYAFAYTNDIVNVPMDSNQYLILDETIPFYQLVLHGYVNYAGAPLNLADDYTYELLKSIETGAGLYFEWIYADNSILKETDFEHLYSVNYANWYDEAVSLYKRINTALQPVRGKEITDHKRVMKELYEVTYEDVKVYVNYSDKDIQYEGITVKANDFSVKVQGA